MRADGRDGALEEHGRVRFADKVHQRTRDGHDDAGEVEGPAPVACTSGTYSFPPCDVQIPIERKNNIPVERGSNIARIDRSENETQIRDQGPGRECPHAAFAAEEKVVDTAASRHGQDRSDDAGDEPADENARDVRSSGDR